jgi:competence CoiA-like predicted nuclease
MLTAIRDTDNKKVVGALIEKDKNATYHCEYCKKEAIHHKSESQVRIGHFKHKQGASHCPNQTNETEWHYKTKYDIYKYIYSNWGDKLKEIEVEKWICNNSIRSDIYLETSKNKIAIEVQATILTPSEIKRRTAKYFKNGIAVMWILPFEYDRI